MIMSLMDIGAAVRTIEGTHLLEYHLQNHYMPALDICFHASVGD